MPNLTVLCDQFKHCADCRAAGKAGDAWREGILRHYRYPEGWPGVDGCKRGLAIGWVPTEFCDRCGAFWHTTGDCPVDPDYVPTPGAATAGGCGCAGDQAADVARPE